MLHRLHRGALLLAAASALGIAGCGGGGSDSTEPPAPEADGGTPPATSPGFVAFGTSANSASLAWPAAAGRYAIERRTSGGAWSGVADIDASAGGWLDTGLAAGTAYDYRLTAIDEGGGAGRALGQRSVTTTNEAGIVTAAGVPQGGARLQQVGPAGGRIASADNAIAIDVPAGALPGDTAVTAQAVSNAAPDGVGAGLKLSFAVRPTQPLTLTLGWDAADDRQADGMRIAVQRGDGAWITLPLTAIDHEARTLTAQLPPEVVASGAEPRIALEFHVVKYLAFYLSPSHSRVKVKHSVELVPHARVRGYDTEIGTCERFETGMEACIYQQMMETRTLPLTNSKAGYGRQWLVFAEPGGNATDGRVVPHGDIGATYTAPAEVPNPSLVWVSFTSRHTASKRSLTLAAKVDVYDDHWTGTMKAVDGPSGAGTTLTSIAHVTWQRDDAASHGSISVYRALGVLDVDATDEDCTVTVAPASQPISTDPRLVELQVNEDTREYTARLITVWPAEITAVCPKASTTRQTLSAGWGWDVSGLVRPDGRTIEGFGTTEDGHTIEWSFRR